jgi:hypothetical protein
LWASSAGTAFRGADQIDESGASKDEAEGVLLLALPFLLNSTDKASATTSLSSSCTKGDAAPVLGDVLQMYAKKSHNFPHFSVHYVSMVRLFGSLLHSYNLHSVFLPHL